MPLVSQGMRSFNPRTLYLHDHPVTDPDTEDGSGRGVPQTKIGTRSVSDLSLEVLGL